MFFEVIELCAQTSSMTRLLAFTPKLFFGELQKFGLLHDASESCSLKYSVALASIRELSGTLSLPTFSDISKKIVR